MTDVGVMFLLLAIPASLRSVFWLVLDSQGHFGGRCGSCVYNEDETQGGSSVPARGDCSVDSSEQSSRMLRIGKVNKECQSIKYR